jgi:hypothetical protein
VPFCLLLGRHGLTTLVAVQERFEDAEAVRRLETGLLAAVRAGTVTGHEFVRDLVRVCITPLSLSPLSPHWDVQDLRRRVERRGTVGAPVTLQAAHEELLAEYRRLLVCFILGLSAVAPAVLDCIGNA